MYISLMIVMSMPTCTILPINLLTQLKHVAFLILYLMVQLGSNSNKI